MPLAPEVVSALITGAAAIGSAGINAGAGIAAGKINVRKNKKLMKYQNDIAMRNWEIQNNYNHPAMQMSRYKAAGINPYSIAGSTMSGAAASGVPYPQTLSGGDEMGHGIAGIANMLQSSMTWLRELKNAKKQGDNLDKDLELKEAEKGLKESQKAGQDTQNSINSYILTHNLPFTTKKLENEVKNLAAQNILLNLQGENMSIRNKIDQYTFDELMPIRKLAMELDNRMAQYNADYMQPAQLAETWSRVGLNKANTALSYTNSAKAAHEIDNIIREGLNIQKRGEGIDLENSMKLNFGTSSPGSTLWSLPAQLMYRITGAHKTFYKKIHH